MDMDVDVQTLDGPTSPPSQPNAEESDEETLEDWIRKPRRFTPPPIDVLEDFDDESPRGRRRVQRGVRDDRARSASPRRAEVTAEVDELEDEASAEASGPRDSGLPRTPARRAVGGRVVYRQDADVHCTHCLRVGADECFRLSVLRKREWRAGCDDCLSRK
ncbi:hypothetical protein EXIGLDRAFT_763909, partial [Exidia glandulosa HHB12029]